MRDADSKEHERTDICLAVSDRLDEPIAFGLERGSIEGLQPAKDTRAFDCDKVQLKRKRLVISCNGIAVTLEFGKDIPATSPRLARNEA